MSGLCPPCHHTHISTLIPLNRVGSECQPMEFLFLFLLLLLLLRAAPEELGSNTFFNMYYIQTISGRSNTGSSGDGNAASNALLNSPLGMVFNDVKGVLIFSDSNNNKIRAIDDRGFISTVAGSGFLGWNGDATQEAREEGMDALLAHMFAPSDVAVDERDGTLYITDTGNNVIRMVSAGRIYTLGGNTTYGYAGNGSQPDNQTMFAEPRCVEATSKHHRLSISSPSIYYTIRCLF